MNTKALLLGAAASIAFAGSANAAHFNGWYIGLEGGANWIDDADATVGFATIEGGSIVTTGTIDFDTGWAVLATIGYAFDDHWRLELEGGYRSNDTTGGYVEVTEWSLMMNALYDIALSPSLDLTLGAGAGWDRATIDLGGVAEDSDGNFAYQGIAGLSFAVGKRTDLTLTYRYLHVQEPSFDPLGVTFDLDDVTKHTVTLGLRFDLAPDAEPAPPAPPPPPPPPPPPIAYHPFVIFFGFGKCNITSEADAVLSEAAAAAKSKGSTEVLITGHTDTVGSDTANQQLSECRANAAKSNLIAKGVPGDAITTSGKGESDLMVDTGDNVKEPQNRRVVVDMN